MPDDGEELYNAPYLDVEEHAALDHTGIPGVGGGGGGGAIFGSYIYMSKANQTVTANGSIDGTTLVVVSQAGDDLVWDGATGQLTFVTHGIYKISVLATWDVFAQPGASREIFCAVVDPGTQTFPALVALSALRTRDYIGDLTNEDSPLLRQTMTAVGELEGAIISFAATNYDSAQSSDLNQFTVLAARIA